jgi:hypothetical protein
MAKATDEKVPEGHEVVYTAYITLKDGRRIYAHHYGRKCWRIVVRKKSVA